MEHAIASCDAHAAIPELNALISSTQSAICGDPIFSKPATHVNFGRPMVRPAARSFVPTFWMFWGPGAGIGRYRSGRQR